MNIINRKTCKPVLATFLLATVSQISTLMAGDNLAAEAKAAIAKIQSADSSLTNLLGTSAGYVVFPSVGKGGVIFGAEHGNGVVYEKGKAVGEATLTEINVGPQLGGGIFYEVIFFESDQVLANFKEGHCELSAEVNATLAEEGAALNAKYRDGIMIFTLPRSGLMAQAAVGGQKFSYKPRIDSR